MFSQLGVCPSTGEGEGVSQGTPHGQVRRGGILGYPPHPVARTGGGVLPPAPPALVRSGCVVPGVNLSSLD